MREVNQIGTFGIQDTISYCVGNQIQTKNLEQGSPGISGNETSGGKKILSGLGVYFDRYLRRPFTFAHGDSTKVLCEYGCRDAEEKHEQALKPEVSFPQTGVLGQRRYMVQRIFRLYSWNK